MSQLYQKMIHVVLEICMWFLKQHDSVLKPHKNVAWIKLERNLFFNIHSVWFQNDMLGSMWSQNYTGMWVLYFACFYLTRQLGRIDPTEVSTCRGSFGGFETTCFQLDWAARIKTTRIFYFSCDRAPLPLHLTWADNFPKLGWPWGIIFNPLEPRAPAGLPLVLACPHKKHINATKRGLRKGEWWVST